MPWVPVGRFLIRRFLIGRDNRGCLHFTRTSPSREPVIHPSVFGNWFDMEDLQVQPRTEAGELAIEHDRVQALELIPVGLLGSHGGQVKVAGEVSRTIGGEPLELVPPDGIPEQGEVIPDHGRVIIQILPEIRLHPNLLAGLEAGGARGQEVMVGYGSVDLGVKSGRVRPEFAAGGQPQQAAQEDDPQPAGTGRGAGGCREPRADGAARNIFFMGVVLSAVFPIIYNSFGLRRYGYGLSHNYPPS